MWVLRLLGIVSAIAVAGGVLAYVLTGNAKYVQFAWRLFRYALFVALLMFGLLILERVAIIPF